METLAYVGGSRWRIETEFETGKNVGLDEYETRTWAGWHHHVALCLLGGAFLPATGLGGKRCPGSPGPNRVVREMLPRKSYGPDELLRWLEETQLRNEQARLSHQTPLQTSQTDLRNPSLNRRCNTSVLHKGLCLSVLESHWLLISLIGAHPKPQGNVSRLPGQTSLPSPRHAI